MNIIINNYCNLTCEYCFAKDVMEEQRQQMTLEQFQWALDFLDASNDGNIRIVGGEPTLHPQ